MGDPVLAQPRRELGQAPLGLGVAQERVAQAELLEEQARRQGLGAVLRRRRRRRGRVAGREQGPQVGVAGDEPRGEQAGGGDRLVGRRARRLDHDALHRAPARLDARRQPHQRVGRRADEDLAGAAVRQDLAGAGHSGQRGGRERLLDQPLDRPVVGPDRGPDQRARGVAGGQATQEQHPAADDDAGRGGHEPAAPSQERPGPLDESVDQGRSPPPSGAS
ncbi:MAG: hypothetical protein KF878_33450 [Planctomycetes bacterium]|nr:hypothetical protein [Planctomycetota bacterium]